MRNLFRGLSFIVLPAIIWLFVNATINSHTHYMSNGYSISHAHPYNKTTPGPLSGESHNHSEKELILLNLISNPLAPIISFLFAGLTLISFQKVLINIQTRTEPVRKYYQVHGYHAPPTF